jgi:hypothetical protein
VNVEKECTGEGIQTPEKTAHKALKKCKKHRVASFNVFLMGLLLFYSSFLTLRDYPEPIEGAKRSARIAR